MEPMYRSGGELGLVVVGVALVGVLVGLAWIRRITRNPDDGPSSWRSRRR